MVVLNEILFYDFGSEKRKSLFPNALYFDPAKVEGYQAVFRAGSRPRPAAPPAPRRRARPGDGALGHRR